MLKITWHLRPKTLNTIYIQKKHRRELVPSLEGD